MARSLGRIAGLLGFLALFGCESFEPPTDPEDVSLDDVLKREPASLEEIQSDVAQGRYRTADLKLADRLAQNPEDYDAAFVHGELLLQMGREDSAMGRFTLASQSPGLRPLALQGLGLSLLKIGGPHESARQNFEEAASLDPTLWRSHNALGQIYDSNRKWDEATAAYQQAIALRPQEAILHSNLGMSYLLRKRYVEATAKFREALALDPELQVASANLRMSYALQGRYLQALAGVPERDMPDALNNVGYAAMLSGDFDSAEAYLNRALALSPAYHRKAASNLRRLEELRALAAEGTP